jgi:hypothetical protein
MGELLLMLLIPPFIGVVTYAVLRIIWARDNDKIRRAINHHGRDFQ